MTTTMTQNTMIQTSGADEAVAEFNQAQRTKRALQPEYAIMYANLENGEIWTDTFDEPNVRCDYKDDAIVNLMEPINSVDYTNRSLTAYEIATGNDKILTGRNMTLLATSVPMYDETYGETVWVEGGYTADDVDGFVTGLMADRRALLEAE